MNKIYITIHWFYHDNGVIHSSDIFEMESDISYNRYRTILNNFRFDDYHYIISAKNKIVNYIKNSPKHKYKDAKVVVGFLPYIFIEAEKK